MTINSPKREETVVRVPECLPQTCHGVETLVRQGILGNHATPQISATEKT